jgi:peroxiredoxin
MINFWQNVQQSRNELTLIQGVYGKWPQDKLAILAISWKQTPAVVQSVVNSKGLTLPILIDETGEVAEKYDIARSPVTLFIDAQGIIKDRKDYPFKTEVQIESVLNSIP